MIQGLEITTGDHVLGNRDARVVLMEYGDFQCPDSGEAYWIVQDLKRKWGEDLTFVYRHFPLVRIHPMAELAAEASEFAAQNGLFWEMHDTIYENQARLGLEMLLEVGEGLGLDAAALQDALLEHRFRQRVMKDRTSATNAGVKGTPSFFLNGVRFHGLASELSIAISHLLGSERAA